MIDTIIEIVLLLYAVALLLLVPTREVTQPPGRLQTAWEVLFPGTSPAWHVFGGLALIAWSYFVLQDLLILRLGSPYIIAMIATPNLSKGYGIPAPDQWHDVLRLINPSWVWVYLAPAGLFGVNLFLVLRARRQAG